MRYEDHFWDKHGFGDGEEIPEDAWAVRKVYCALLNAILKQRQAPIRVLMYDRPGVHNCCCVDCVRHDANTPEERYDEAYETISPEEQQITATDRRYLREANEIFELLESEVDVDGLVDVTVYLDKEELKDVVADDIPDIVAYWATDVQKGTP